MSTLKNHPFAVESFFKTSLVLTYAVPKSDLISSIPECLELDTFNNKWAFVAIAMVDTKNLRPKGFPEWAGKDFILVGCRVFVWYINRQGKRLRGLYILRSETNKSLMTFWGNTFTHYNYSTTDIRMKKENNTIQVSSEKSSLDVRVKINDSEISLPSSSPFSNWKEARRFAGPLPFTFTYDPSKKEVLIIEGVRENWNPLPARIEKSDVGFIDSLSMDRVVLANAFVIENIPYYWKKGKTEVWTH